MDLQHGKVGSSLFCSTIPESGSFIEDASLLRDFGGVAGVWKFRGPRVLTVQANRGVAVKAKSKLLS